MDSVFVRQETIRLKKTNRMVDASETERIMPDKQTKFPDLATYTLAVEACRNRNTRASPDPPHAAAIRTACGLA
jgi:hypothetical protein